MPGPVDLDKILNPPEEKCNFIKNRDSVEVTFVIHQITPNWFADVSRQRIIELLFGYTDSDFENEERFSDMRDEAREMHEIQRVKFWRKPDGMKMTEFITDRVGIPGNALERIQEVFRHF